MLIEVLVRGLVFLMESHLELMTDLIWIIPMDYLVVLIMETCEFIYRQIN